MTAATATDREALRAAVRDLLADKERPVDDTWALLTGQIGAAGLAVPETHGGAGFSLRECGVVLEELGRVLAPVPYLSSAVLATAALRLADVADGLSALASGARVGAVAWAESGSWDVGAIRSFAERDGESWRVSGRKEHVIDGAEATLLLVLARNGEGLALFGVEADAAGMRRTGVVTVDQTRAQAVIEFDRTPATLLSRDGERIVERLLDVAAVALAAEQIGGAARALEMTIEYAKTRVQFNRPIGSFQAVKHRLADMYVLVESARSLTYAALDAVADDTHDASRLAAAAKSMCSEAYCTVTGEAIQLHGGIGITWEHDAQRYFKRAYSSAALFGSPLFHRRRLLGRLGELR